MFVTPEWPLGRSVAEVAKVAMGPWPYGRQGRCLGLIRFHAPDPLLESELEAGGPTLLISLKEV